MTQERENRASGFWHFPSRPSNPVTSEPSDSSLSRNTFIKAVFHYHPEMMLSSIPHVGKWLSSHPTDLHCNPKCPDEGKNNVLPFKPHRWKGWYYHHSHHQCLASKTGPSQNKERTNSLYVQRVLSCAEKEISSLVVSFHLKFRIQIC